MMDFSTHCFKKQRRLLLEGALSVVCVALLPLAAQAESVRLDHLQMERSGDEWLLTAQVRFQLADPVMKALQKGIPLHFVAEALVRRERWYWRDKTEAAARRYMRVAYQPLTGRWRLTVGSEPWSETGVGAGLTLSYDTWQEVQAALQRIARWPVATVAETGQDERRWLQFRYWLDLNQLPRALQLGARGQADWAIDVQRRLDLSSGGAP